MFPTSSLLAWVMKATILPVIIGRATEHQSCELAVVGAGAGGAYAAWKASNAGLRVCIFELSHRPGGRIHSMRGEGPRKDLVVEAGAYRFSKHPIKTHLGNATWVINTPITASVVKELGLQTKVYNPDPNQWDHGMFKVVDENGHNAGYLTMVEHMLEQAVAKGALLAYNTKVEALISTDTNTSLSVQLGNGSMVLAKAVLLNVPQHPLLELLRRSHGPLASIFPKPLYVPVTYPIMKLYIHYSDAWWRNDLGLLSGPFSNSLEHPLDPMSLLEGIPPQKPAPLMGQYHDGDVRCDGPGGRCRGFLQAFYGGDLGVAGNGKRGMLGAVKFYSLFVDSISTDSATHLSPKNPVHRELMAAVHDALVEVHLPQLNAVNATAKVKASFPTGAVLSIWSQGVQGIHGGCHMPKPGPHSEQLSKEALQPLPGWPVYVANEAYGPNNCWAEGSLAMSKAVVNRLTAKSLNSDSEEQLLAQKTSPPTDPFLLAGDMSSTFKDPHRSSSEPMMFAI